MSKKKKLIIISVPSLIIIAIIIGLIIFLTSKNNNNEADTNLSKISKLYQELSEEKAFSITTTIDDNNKQIYAKNNDTNMAYIDTIYNGEESKFVIKEGNSYLLKDENKIYYTYQNNEIDLNKVLEQLNEIKDSQLLEGKEEINGQEFDYLEYTEITNFAIKISEEDDTEDIKTRFYFNKDDLVYIKTIAGNNQELLSVEISYDIDSNLFEIPEDYRAR